jgi:gliding motility-associated-like protein
MSQNGNNYNEIGSVSPDAASFVLNDFTINAEYCVKVIANLNGGATSASYKSCLTTKMQNPPNWINADYATVREEGGIYLSFSIDPGSEIDLFALERREGYSGQFKQIAQIPGTDSEKVTYTDKTISQDAVYFYRLSAVNNCNIKSVMSNIASNIVLNSQNKGNEIILRWNKYRAWLGSVASYRIFMDTGNGFNEIDMTTPSDTTYSISIPDVMYTLTEGKVCFYVSSSERGNPYGITGESVSGKACISIEETVTVPNIFSPDGDGINDKFKPVITFTPSSYQLSITDRQRKTMFETRDYNESWDGTINGSPVSQGVYLWFLKLTTPSGKNITRTGTLTVIKTR